MERRYAHLSLLGLGSAGGLFLLLIFLTTLPSLPGLSGIAGSDIELARLVILFGIAGLADLPMREIAFMSLLSLTFGLNVALFLEYRRRFGTSVRIAPGIAGLVGGIAGAGCAACGTLILAPLLATGTGIVFLSTLPYGGEEIGWVGLALLLFSCAVLVRGMRQPYR